MGMRLPKIRIWNPVECKFSYLVMGDPCVFLNDVVFYRSTGMTDRKGIEIFEGDIVVADYRHSYEEPFLITDLFSFGYEMYEYFCGESDGFTIIGNVCENPEILEGVIHQ